MYRIGHLLYFLGVLAHDGMPWIKASSLKCTGADSCKRDGTDGHVDVSTLTCSGDRACRGFDVKATESISCSGYSACEHIKWKKRRATLQCSGEKSCSSLIGWWLMGNLGNLATLRVTWPQTHYQLGIEINGIVYPSIDQLWASYKFIVAGEIVQGDDPRGFKLVRYVYAEGLQYNNGLTSSGASASTWYRFLYEQHGEDSNSDVVSFLLVTNDEAQTSANVNVYFRKNRHPWSEVGTVLGYETLRKKFSLKEWELAVEVDGHIAIVEESTWDSKKRFMTEPYVCNDNGVLKLIQAVFHRGLIDPSATEQLITNWYIYYYEVGGAESFTFLPDISSTITAASNKLYVRFK